jgi:sialidase-1
MTARMLYRQLVLLAANSFWVATAGAAPDPATIYAWFKADAGTITDSAGAVTNWSNQATSGSYTNRNLTRFGGAPQLVSVSTPGSPMNLLRLGGSDNLYAIPTSFGSLAKSRTIAAYFRLNSTSAGFLFDGASNVGMTRAQVRDGDWQVGIQPPPLANGANPDPVTLPAASGVWQLHFFSFELLGAKTRITHSVWGGASLTYTNAQTNGLAALIVGENVSQSFGLAADLLEFLVYDRVPSTAEQQDLAGYLTNKWAGVLAATNLPPVAPPVRVPVFVNGQYGYACYRIPAMVTTTNGTVIAVADGRISDCGDIPHPLDLVARRSFDNGSTWGPLQIIAAYGTDTSTNDVDTYPYYGITNPVQRVAAGDAALLLDRTNGRVWTLYDNGAYVAGQAYNRVIKLEMRYSDNDGATWSAALDIEALNPSPRPAGSQFLTGPGNGIQLAGGPHSGRLIFPVYVSNGANYSTLIYSDDHGQTWRLGGNAGTGGGEVQMAETPGGGLIASMRDASFSWSGVRTFSRSTDGGTSWGAPFTNTVSPLVIPDPACQGNIYRLTTTNDSNASRLIHANAASASSRVNMTLRISYDEGATWPVSNQVYAGSAAYSSVTRLATTEIGLLFEIDNYTAIDFVRRSVSQMTSGADSLPPYTVWAGEHFTPAQLSNPAVSAADADPDGDGMSNYAESIAGTNPLDPTSMLKLDFASRGTNGFTLAFPAISNKSYTLQSTSSLQRGSWQRFLDVPPLPTNAAVQLLVSPTNPTGFFRLTTPQSH